MMSSIKSLSKNLLTSCTYKAIVNHSSKTNIFDDSCFSNVEKVYPIKKYSNGLMNLSDNNCKYSLSIIIPIYNAENYIEKCLLSLINQKTIYNYEIVLVNDGSNDKSLEIIESLKNRYKSKNITIISQDNHGISYSRNVGLKTSKGEYVGFIDNDDYVSEDYVQTLLDEAYKKYADYVKCGHYYVNSDEKIFDKETNDYEIITANQDINYYKYNGYIWGGIQRRSLWDNFCFPDGFWYEDIITKLYMYQKANIFVNVDKCLYYKRIHEKNASFTVWSAANNKCIDQLYLVLLINEIKEKQGFNNSLLRYLSDLNELGPLLYRRTIKLDKNLKKDIFLYAANYINNLNNDFEIENKYSLEKYLDLAFKNYDYKLWKLIGLYNRLTK